jgi:cytochrome c556
MKLKRNLLFTACLTVLAIAVFAQSEEDHQKWMKTVGVTSGSLRKNLGAKNGEAAAADANKLQDIFGQVHDFWQIKNVDDAMKFSIEARDVFREVAEHASMGMFTDASAALKKLDASCSGCHTAHREKAADGSWKLK